MGQDCPYSVVGYHAQQCAEKYIKALLVCHSIEFPKVHDLNKIMRLVPSDKAIPLSAEEQDRLTDYATASRYPGESEPPTRAEAEEAVALARKVRAVVRSYLPPESLQEDELSRNDNLL